MTQHSVYIDQATISLQAAAQRKVEVLAGIFGNTPKLLDQILDSMQAAAKRKVEPMPAYLSMHPSLMTRA